jgi:hypothetical protein
LKLDALMPHLFMNLVLDEHGHNGTSHVTLARIKGDWGLARGAFFQALAGAEDINHHPASR